MNYKLYFDEEDKIVRVKADCLLDNSIRKDILREIALHLKSKKYSKAIIDLTESKFDLSEPIEGSVELTIHLSDLGMSPDAKLAFVYVDAETHRKTFEKISQKIGYQLRYFKTVDDAHNWLKDS